MSEPKNKSGPVLAVAEHRQGKLLDPSITAAALARRIAGKTGAKAMAAVLSDAPTHLAEQAARLTGENILAVSHPDLREYDSDNYVSALAALADKIGPSYIVVPHTATGWDFAPRLAVRMGAASIAGVSGLADQERPAFLRRALGGKIEFAIAAPEDLRCVVTVNPGAVKPEVVKDAGEVEEVALSDEDVGAAVSGSRTIGISQAPRSSLDLGKAEVIVTAGRGAGDEQGISLVRELAGLFDKGALGASRPIVDAGLLSFERQVGQTGQTVTPKLYIACGVSGAIQHLSGMLGSELIVAINRDKKAAIFGAAQLGVVADLREFLPVLISKIKEIGK